MTTDPVNLGHRVYVTTDDGYCAACICGWRVTRHTREQRDQATNQHQTQR
jgi:hypothetical protein